MPEKQKQIEKPVVKNDAGFFTEELNKKLPILFVSLVFFLLACYTFISTGITFSYIFDFSSALTNPTQLISLQSIIFAVVFSIALSLSAFFGFGLKMPQAAIPIVLFGLIGLVSFVVLPGYAPLFLVFGLAFGASAIFASKKEKFDFDSFSTSTRRALTVFVILAVLFSIVKIELNKDAYFDQFLTGAASLSPQLAKQVLPLCVQPFSKVNAEDVVPRSASDLQAQASYDQCRTVMIASAGSSAGNLEQTIPSFSQLSAADQTQLQDQTRAATLQSVRQLINGLVSQLESTAVQDELANFKPSKRDLDELRTQLSAVSYFQLVENYFSIFIGFIIFSLLSVFTSVAKFISYPINYIILKASELKIEAKE
ncbi:MAG: hypothetical protein Q8R15_02975 [Candidatus Micrarchaeota archaeon]|nr:hypothetical protein [Candidatus Micrarchaeota archaeon]